MSRVFPRRVMDLPERMDDPACDPTRLANTYRQFARLNPALSGWRRLYVRELRPLLIQNPDRPKILDLGCGGGDVLRQLAHWVNRDNLSATFTGADPDERAIAFAQAAPNCPPELRFVVAGAEDLYQRGERFDIVLSNHVLHHLADTQLPNFLHTSALLSRRLVLHSDLRRSGRAWLAFHMAWLVFYRSFIVEDGLRSIRRSFTWSEMRHLAPPCWQVRPAAPFRLIVRRELAP